MKIELALDEVRTILAALSVYQDVKEDAWLSQGWLSDQEEAGSAKWVWQKIAEQRDVERIEAEIRERNAPVDPFSLPPREEA
jgi:hypothetical protein